MLNSVCNIEVVYLDKADVTVPDLTSAKYVHGTLKVHHVERVNENQLKFHYNSSYKQQSDVLTTLVYNDIPGIDAVNTVNSNSDDNDSDIAVSYKPALGHLVCGEIPDKEKRIAYILP